MAAPKSTPRSPSPTRRTPAAARTSGASRAASTPEAPAVEQAPRAADALSTTTAPVVVHGSDVPVERAHFELPLAEARSRFGGFDVPALLGGALAGLGTAAVLGGIATAVGSEVGQGDPESLAVGGLVTALVLLALSALAGGWVAGRAARFDGARNGLLAGLLLSLLLALLGAAGAYTAAEGGLPVSLDGERLTTAAVVAAVLGLLVTLAAAALGGRLGARWHRDVDDVLVGTRPGAVAVPHGAQVVR